MGRKKKKPVKPWCWYCNREFDDDKILVQHQRAKHFKCPFCHKKLYSGPGLTVHCIQVHKEHLDKIPEALPNRNSVDIDIYGMQGIPEEDVREHERLKRGVDDSVSQNSQDHRNRANSSKATSNQQQPQMQNIAAMSAMHAAMYQHAMNIGAMPPPPNFMMPPGMPPPPGFPPGFMPPLGFPPNPALMHLGMPSQPPFPQLGPPRYPSMLPSTISNQTHMEFAPPPPPPSPPPQLGASAPTASTSSVPPPPPMSGVGHLIGIPPPNYNPTYGRLLPIPSNNNNREGSASDRHLKRSPKPNFDQKPTNKNQASSQQSESSTDQELSSAATISKPPQTITATETIVHSVRSENFIDVPTLKARIMHPNNDLSLEEIRLGLSKYRSMLENLKSSPNPEVVAS